MYSFPQLRKRYRSAFLERNMMRHAGQWRLPASMKYPDVEELRESIVNGIGNCGANTRI